MNHDIVAKVIALRGHSDAIVRAKAELAEKPSAQALLALQLLQRQRDTLRSTMPLRLVVDNT